MMISFSSGIGHAIAFAFATQGTKLIFCADLQPRPRMGAGTKEHDDHDDNRAAREIICDMYGKEILVCVHCNVSVEAKKVEKHHKDRQLDLLERRKRR